MINLKNVGLFFEKIDIYIHIYIYVHTRYVIDISIYFFTVNYS